MYVPILGLPFPNEIDRVAQKPVVALLLLPPAPIVPPTGDHIPLLSLPLGFAPRPDPFTGIKKYTGRVLDRIIGTSLVVTRYHRCRQRCGWNWQFHLGLWRLDMVEVEV
ncbi:hypothetical protein EDB86DRAFT_2881635, partial [Lactarius hatsudake]